MAIDCGILNFVIVVLTMFGLDFIRIMMAGTLARLSVPSKPAQIKLTISTDSQINN